MNKAFLQALTMPTVRTSQDYAKAVEWYTKAANLGYVEAQFNLGVMYYEGERVHQSKATAKEYFDKSCNNGDQDGCDEYQKLNQR